MRLFYWDNVLADYTAGHVLIVAKNLNEAMKMLKKEDDYAFRQINGSSPTITSSTNRKEPFIKVQGGGS